MSNICVYYVDDYRITIDLISSMEFMSVKIKAIENNDCIMYENIITFDSLQLPLQWNEIYHILIKCLSKRNNHNIFFTTKPEHLEMQFQVVFDGSVCLNFEIILPEKKYLITDKNIKNLEKEIIFLRSEKEGYLKKIEILQNENDELKEKLK